MTHPVMVATNRRKVRQDCRAVRTSGAILCPRFSRLGETPMMPWNFGSTSPILAARFDLASVGHASYLLVDVASKTAAVIDPQPEVTPYLEAAARVGARIRHVFLTKLHSDFECGHLALADRCGAVIYVGARVRPEYAHLPVKDGDVLQFGSTGLRILDTPGHALEGIAVLAADVSRSCTPWGIFAGDLLFDGDLGRPEPRLADGLSTGDLARLLHHTVRRILTLPGALRVFCGHRSGPSRGSEPPRLSALRRSHPLLQPLPAGVFLRAVTSGMRSLPLGRRTRSSLNRSAAAEPSDALPPLPADEFISLVDRGTVPIDLREPMEFGAAHVRGSISLGLSAKFEDWAGAVLDPTEDYILIANPGAEEEAAARLRPLVGCRIRGVLDGGMTSLESRRDLLEQCPPLLASAGKRGIPAARVDVREPGPRATGRQERRLPLEELLGRLGEIPACRGPVAVTDVDPYRAHSAASLLRRRGWPEARAVVDLDSRP